MSVMARLSSGTWGIGQGKVHRIMSKKFLGKVIATAALGGAALLIAPGIALADDGHGDWPKAQDDKGGYSQCAEWGDEAKGDEAKGDKGKGDEGKGDEAKGGEAKKDERGKPGEAAKEEHGKPGGDEDKKECDSPKGWVDGGAAGSSTDVTLATAGGTLLGAASLGGLVLLRRRRTDGSLA